MPHVAREAEIGDARALAAAVRLRGKHHGNLLYNPTLDAAPGENIFAARLERTRHHAA